MNKQIIAGVPPIEIRQGEMKQQGDILLEVKNLSIRFAQGDKMLSAVNDVSFNIKRGALTAIVGESGSGKTMTALSFLQLLPKEAEMRGQLLFHPHLHTTLDLATASKKQIRKIRGNEIAMIFQEPATSLNPLFTCGYQVSESLLLHKKLNRKQAKAKTIELFHQVELPLPEEMYKKFPHQISGGQKQRVMIAMAMSCSPSLLVADEPTTALDVRVQKNILILLKKLQQQQQLSMLLVTHDLDLVNAFADEVLVMCNGMIMEQGKTKDILHNPQHGYTKALIACKPNQYSKGKKLPVVSDFTGDTVLQSDKAQPIPVPVFSDHPMLQVKNLKVHFTSKRNFLQTPISAVKAVDDVSFSVMKGETLGLVGESGCGKTTLGRCILQLIRPSSGTIWINGQDMQTLNEKNLRKYRKDFQIVFQDPYGSLNPRKSIGDAIMEPLIVHGLHENNAIRREKVMQLLEQVNIDKDSYSRYPHQFSGGQRQRICIARALALEPALIVFDESVSALDVSVQAQILNLISELKSTLHFTSIFISHNLSVVHYISDRILVMNGGKIVEQGTADDILLRPKEPYTRELIASIL